MHLLPRCVSSVSRVHGAGSPLLAITYRAVFVVRLVPSLMLFAWMTCAPSRSLIYQDASYQALTGSSKRALLVPLDSLHSRYRDNTRAEPDTQYTDSFLTAATKTFLRFETARLYAPVQMETDSGKMATGFRYSVLTGDTGEADSASARVARVARRYDVDLVIVPYACTTGHRVYQPQGWRGNTGPGYRRPAETNAFASCHVQIWAADGDLLFERIGKATISKPLLYGLFNGPRGRARREEAIEEDVVAASRKLYAPPVLRALAKAASQAFLFR